MADISDAAKVRLLGGGPGEKPPPRPLSGSRSHRSRGRPPKPASLVLAAPNALYPAPVATAQPIFLADSAEGADALGVAEMVQPLAQLCATAQTQTPFLAAILGPSGAGKSFALGRLQRAIDGAAGRAGISRARRRRARRRGRRRRSPDRARERGLFRARP